MKVWYCVCILILLYTLIILVEEGAEVIYVSSGQEDGFEPVAYLSCFSLRTFYPNDSQVRLEQMQFALYKHFDKYEGREKWKRKYWVEEDFKLYEKLVLKRISSMDYLIWADQLCIRQDDRRESSKMGSFFEDNTLWLAYNKRTFDRIDLRLSVSGTFNQLIVMNRGYPYSHCLGAGYSRFSCLNECLKKRNRLSKYLYDGHETGLIILNQQNKNESTKDDELECSSQCEKDGCNLIFYFQNADINNTPETKIFNAIPLISRFELVFQFVGLISLILGVSFNLTVSMLLKFVHSKRDELPFVGRKRFLLFLKSSLLLTSLLIFAYLSANVVLDYEDQRSSPIKKETTFHLMQLEPLNVVVCLLLEKSYSYYRNHTLLEIEKDTDKELENIDQIVLEFQDQKTVLNYTVQPLVAFMNKMRCFQLSINPQEPRYRSMLAISKLVIKFKMSYEFYILTNEEKFDSGSFHHQGTNSFVRKFTKTTSGCVEYKQVYPNCWRRRW